MSHFVFGPDWRHKDGLTLCVECVYPYSGLHCDNPGCRVNLSPTRLAEVDTAHARKIAEETERARIHKIRARYR